MPGVYAVVLDNLPLGAFVNKGLTLKTGQTHVHRHLQRILTRNENGTIRPDAIISFRRELSGAPAAHDTVLNRQDEFTKVVFQP